MIIGNSNKCPKCGRDDWTLASFKNSNTGKYPQPSRPWSTKEYIQSKYNTLQQAKEKLTKNTEEIAQFAELLCEEPYLPDRRASMLILDITSAISSIKNWEEATFMAETWEDSKVCRRCGTHYSVHGAYFPNRSILNKHFTGENKICGSCGSFRWKYAHLIPEKILHLQDKKKNRN